MRPLHELVLETAAGTTERSTSRRGVLAGGALALAASATVGLEAVLAQNGGRGGNGGGDIAVLNYALTLEHLENAFYREGIREFGAFEEYIKDVAAHERTHVQYLTQTIKKLGGNPVEEGCYDFGFTTRQAFLETAQVLENTGVMAYDGAISRIKDADLQTAAATIATVEARHASYLNFLNGDNPFPDAFDEPKTQKQILAAADDFFCDE